MLHSEPRRAARQARAALVLASLCALLSVAPGCGFGNTDLLPAPGTTSEGGAALVSAQGVSLLAHPNDWEGDPDALMIALPIRVRLRNDSGVALRVRYGGFRLLGVEERYAALPPIAVGGDEDVWLPEEESALVQEGYGVAPHMAHAWPGVAVAADPEDDLFDRDYHRRHFRRWARRPSAELVARALPEGVLAPGGHVEGYVYFEPVGDDTDAIGDQAPEPRVILVIDLVAADSGEVIGRLDAPFIID